MTAQPRRLPVGGRVDRTTPVAFTFDGRTYQGLRGDTLASALLANGVDVVARSFKFGRPRGIVGSGAEEPNAIVQIGSEAHALPNQRATQVELYEGLVAASSAAHGVRGLIDAGRRVLPAGFYYKMFMAPPMLWRFWEHVLRRGAGLGTVPQGADPDRYDKLNRHCDVMVVGAGPAGLAAALVAARSGARVVIADEQDAFGGSLLSSALRIDGRPAGRMGGRRGARVACIRGRRHAGAKHRRRSLRPQLPDGIGASCRPWAVDVRVRGTTAPASRACQGGRASGRGDRTPARFREQRPSRGHAGVCRVVLRQPLWRRTRRGACAGHEQRRWLPNGIGLAAGRP